MPPGQKTCAAVWLSLALAFAGRALAASHVPVALAERVRRADRVVVGRVASVSPEWQVNEFGDRLIVSVVRVSVSETLKGETASTIDIDVEGGTVGTVTLRVSDLFTPVPGDRATFFLKRNSRGRFVPHLRGQSVMMHDPSGRVADGLPSASKWARPQMTYHVNPANRDVPGPAAITALKAGAAAWLRDAGAFRFVYGGASSRIASGNDGVNLVLFRNASGGSAIATTYTWSSGSRLVETDIVFWDGGFRFFTGTTGCAGTGFYIEDIAAHEFGHALGLGHSSAVGATMFPSVISCDTRMRSLDADDIAGVRALYPAAPTAPPSPTGVRIVR